MKAIRIFTVCLVLTLGAGFDGAMRLGYHARTRAASSCSMCSSSEETADTDWDAAWSRYRMEQVDEVDTEAEVIQTALTDLVLAEANVRAAADAVDAAAEEKAALERELAELRSGAKEQTLDLFLRISLAISCVSLYIRFNTDGFESVAGCVLMPVACALGQV